MCLLFLKSEISALKEEVKRVTETANQIHMQWEKETRDFEEKRNEYKKVAFNMAKIPEIAVEPDIANLNNEILKLQSQLEQKDLEISELKTNKWNLKNELQSVKKELDKIHYDAKTKKQLKERESGWVSLKSPVPGTSSVMLTEEEKAKALNYQHKQKIVELQRELTSCKSKVFKLETTLEQTTKFYEQQLAQKLAEMRHVVELADKARKCRKVAERKIELHMDLLENSFLKSLDNSDEL